MLESTSFVQADGPSNTWQCAKCGYLSNFEADGPFENGWNFCPHCGRPIPMGTQMESRSFEDA